MLAGISSGNVSTMVTPVNISWVLLVCVTMAMMLSAPGFAQDNLCGSRVNFCPDVQNATAGGLAFVHGEREQPMVQSMKCFYLDCCVDNVPHVNSTWYKLMPEKHDWEDVTATGKGCEDDECIMYTADGGQTLVFSSPGDDNDGKYRCVATDGRTTINRTFKVLVVDCRDKPTSIKFTRPSDLQASLDRTFTQNCFGDFGCFGATANDSLVWWSYRDKSGHLVNLTVGKHGHYEVHENISVDKTVKSSLLTIRGVKKEDFSRTFFCHLKMRDLPTDGFNFSLAETGSRTAWKRYIPLIIGMSVMVGVIVLTMVLAYIWCSPIIAFKVKSATRGLPKREARHSHDVMLVSREEAEEACDDEEDSLVLRSLQERLEDKGFRVLNTHEPLTGGKMRRYDNVQNCVSVIFVICTTSLRREKEKYLEGFDLFFSNAAAEKTHMIFVSTQPMPREQWADLSRDYKTVYPDAPKVCTVLTWPGGTEAGHSWGTRGLKRANFWCQLQRFLLQFLSFCVACYKQETCW